MVVHLVFAFYRRSFASLRVLRKTSCRVVTPSHVSDDDIPERLTSAGIYEELNQIQKAILQRTIVVIVRKTSNSQ
jgi:hypothetical protein